MDDVTLTFDPTLFLNGLNAINQGIQTMNNNFTKSQTQSTKNNRSMKLSASNILGVLGKISLVVAPIMGLLRHIPEIGRVFSIAGNIFMRNFLWPLRRFLLPILQRVLDWVRDNRAMFVRWGSVVANIFRAIFNIIKQLWNMLKRLWEDLSSGIENVFGRTVRNITELANLALFKITAIAQFILITLEPIFEWIGRLFVTLLGYVRNFFDGFTEGIGDLMPDLRDMWNSLSRIGRIISNLTDRAGGLNRAFRVLGNVLSMVVGPIIRGVGQLIDGLASAIEFLSIRIAMFQARRAGNVAEMRRLREEQRQLGEGFRQRTLERWGRQAEAWSGAVQNIREAVRGEQPATRVTTNNRGRTVNNNIRNQVTVNVNESQTPRETGAAVTESIENRLREQRFRGGTR